MANIHALNETTIRRIAAGEVVERPANVVKELVENALDAGATQIEVHIQGGGKRLIEVRDNGCGIAQQDMHLAVARHATSKLQDTDIGKDGVFVVSSLGFRGEALAAIGAVSKLRLTSRPAQSARAHMLNVDGGTLGQLRPAAGDTGTHVRVEDLFYATPARLKFLKSERAETMAINDGLKRLALARPSVGFAFYDNGKTRFSLPPQPAELDGQNAPAGHAAAMARIHRVMGRNFVDNIVPVAAGEGAARVSGFAGLPTFHHARNLWQYLFVNARPVRDRLLYGALRAAYHDYIVAARHPAVLLYLDIDPQLVDVNVHPTKAEVRFADAQSVQSLLVGGIRQALHGAGHRATTTNSEAALQAMRPPMAPARASGYGAPGYGTPSYGTPPPTAGLAVQEAQASFVSAGGRETPADNTTMSDKLAQLPLGLARAQLHDSYIVAQTAKGLVIVDQHAAHERIVYEQMKKDLAANGVKRQILLVPDIVELDGDAVALLLEHAQDFVSLGLVIEAFGDGAVLVREVPALLGKLDTKKLLEELGDELASMGKGLALKEKLEAYCGTFACHSSIRAGRKLTGEQMDGLLRAMETTPHAGQCNHGRPTYVELALSDIERLFGRR